MSDWDSTDCSLPGSSVHGILQARILTIGGCLLQGIFPTQGSNPGLPCCRWILYCLSHQGSIFICLKISGIEFSSVQFLNHVWLFATPWTTARQASLSITSSQSLLKLMSIESVMPSNNLTHCHPLLLLPSIFPSIRVFSNESAFCIRWPKYWSFLHISKKVH